MFAKPVEWVLVVFYGPSAHRATYGRLDGSDTKYTKDYIQLSKKADFLRSVTSLFPTVVAGAGSAPIKYKWPQGTATGDLVFNSADRPHLKWETSQGAPKAWKMAPTPNASTEETIPGDPTHLNFVSAEKEYKLLGSRGAGQPFLLAIKLRDEPGTLHVRAYLKNPDNQYQWADLQLAPQEIQDLAAKTSRTSALAWSPFHSGGTIQNAAAEAALSKIIASADTDAAIAMLDESTGRNLVRYLQQPGYGLFFDPSRNHDAWFSPAPLSSEVLLRAEELVQKLDARFPASAQSDQAAEALESDADETEAFREQIRNSDYAVPDSIATAKTRGSAQRAFAMAVKANYEGKCAITGVATKDFLVASHIVPWSKDQSIRLDPSNGICLSVLVDRAFEKGYLLVENDLTIRINWDKVGRDDALRQQLSSFDGQKLRTPVKETPSPEYLQRRREINDAGE